MDIEKLTNPLVRRAIAAWNASDRAAWLALFTDDATLSDDGTRHDLVQWSDAEIFGKGQGRLVAIDRQEDGGLTVFGRLHSAQWGTFKTFVRFRQRGDRFSALEVGQVDD